MGSLLIFVVVFVVVGGGGGVCSTDGDDVGMDGGSESLFSYVTPCPKKRARDFGLEGGVREY